MSEEKKRGRPRQAMVAGERKSIAFRVTEPVYAKLTAEADRSGYSLSELIERVLERHVAEPDVFRTIRETVRQEMRAEFEARRGAHAYNAAFVGYRPPGFDNVTLGGFGPIPASQQPRPEDRDRYNY